MASHKPPPSKNIEVMSHLPLNSYSGRWLGNWSPPSWYILESVNRVVTCTDVYTVTDTQSTPCTACTLWRVIYPSQLPVCYVSVPNWPPLQLEPSILETLSILKPVQLWNISHRHQESKPRCVCARVARMRVCHVSMITVLFQVTVAWIPCSLV